MTDDRTLERRHDPAAHPLWEESWYVDFSQDDGIGGFVRLALYPNLGVAWWWAYLVTPEGLVVVRDHQVPLPRRPESLEVRSDGLWGELTCETPMVHWSLAMEAFGLVLDGPNDALRPDGELGDRRPVGVDLEWEAFGPSYEHPHAAGKAAQSRGHYQHAGRVHGEIIVGAEAFVIDGTGERDHSWGSRNWWRQPWHWAAFQRSDEWSRALARPLQPGIEYASGYVADADGDPHPVRRFTVATRHDAADLPVSAHYQVEDDISIHATVVAVAPIVLGRPDDPAAPPSRLDRALCRFETPAGTGLGWAEWLSVSPTPRG